MKGNLSHLFLLILTCIINLPFELSGQKSYPLECEVDYSALTSKYWEYRNTFNKHFIVVDRDPSGCVNDGLGQNPVNGCLLTKHGLSLPGTSINIVPNAAYGETWDNTGDIHLDGLGDRNDGNAYFNDPACGGQTSWQNDEIHNFMDMGSETPSQLGWYIMLLCTEYEMFRIHDKPEDQQKTLEELFLALQAYRRLDITAQCQMQKLYDDRVPVAPIELCPTQFFSWPSAIRPNFLYHSVLTDCNFTPQLDGYSGFFVREDANQIIRDILNDPSEDQYNIDHIKSEFANISPPCSPNSINQGACYLLKNQNFMSQDQIIGLLNGLVFVKKYIPADAEITTCNNETYNILDISKKIATSIVTRIANDEKTSIYLPGTEYNCTGVANPLLVGLGLPEGELYQKHKIYLSNKEGGDCRAFMLGLAYALKFITGSSVYVNKTEQILWDGLSVLTETINNISYVPSFPGYYTIPRNLGKSQTGLFIDISHIAFDQGINKFNYAETIETQNKEIYPLINNILYPGFPNYDIDEEAFLTMLCNAPCNGQCTRKAGYPTQDNHIWPDYHCANTPGWLGQRWDGAGTDAMVLGDNKITNRIFNGLDYMVLYNLYSLQYKPEEPFTKPNEVNDPLGDIYSTPSHIIGPNYIKLGDTKFYSISPKYSQALIENTNWYTSDDLLISNSTNDNTNVKRENNGINSYISAKYSERREKNIYQTTSSYEPFIVFNDLGIPQFRYTPPVTPDMLSTETCVLSDRLNLENFPNFYIQYFPDPNCEHPIFFANGFGTSPDPDFLFTWSITNSQFQDPFIISAPGLTYLELDATNYIYTLPATVNVKLKVSSISNPNTIKSTLTLNKEIPACSGFAGGGMRISPNPNNGTFTLNLRQGHTLPAAGLNIRIVNPVTSEVINQFQWSSSGQNVSFPNLNTGYYQLQTNWSGNPSASGLIIIK